MPKIFCKHDAFILVGTGRSVATWCSPWSEAAWLGGERDSEQASSQHPATCCYPAREAAAATGALRYSYCPGCSSLLLPERGDGVDEKARSQTGDCAQDEEDQEYTETSRGSLW